MSVFKRGALFTMLIIVISVGGWLTLQLDNRRRDVPVIIYLVDTLRADRLGFAGYDRPTSPVLDELAKESVVFEQAYAPAPWTLPSVASLITSSFPCENGMTERKRLNPAFRTFAERLRDHGYFTGGVYHNVWIGPLTGLDRGYDEFNFRVLEKGEWLSDIDALIGRVDGKPFLAYFHIMEPHDTYLAPYPFISPLGHASLEERLQYKELIDDLARLRQADWLAQQPVGTTDNTEDQRRTIAALAESRDTIELLYDAAVRWSDSTVGQAIEVFKKHDVWDNAIFIFLSDHGEELFDHGGLLHGQSVYEELVRIPLLIRFPGSEFAGVRVESPANLVDVMPTVFDYLGQEHLCEGCRGTSLLPLIRGEPGPDFSISSLRMSQAFYFRPDKEERGDVNLAVRDGPWKGIWNDDMNSLELYDLGKDPAEQVDVSQQFADVAKSLSVRAREWLEACMANSRPPVALGEIDSETMEQLRSLGYFN